MPNWCYNSLTVTSDAEGSLDLFKSKLGGPNDNGDKVEFSFQQFVPRPLDANWREWNNTNWGCKWDAGEVSVSHYPDRTEINFVTPWAPPVAWLRMVAKDLQVKMICKYEEPGMDMFGTITVTKDYFEDIAQDPPPNSDDE